MKTNAIIRIVTWSAVIAILLGILIAGIDFQGIWTHWPWDDDDIPAATHIPEPIDAIEETVATLHSDFYAESNIYIHSKPSTDAKSEGMIEAGDVVRITRDEMINGQHWGYITQPDTGWILLDDHVEESHSATHSHTSEVTTPTPVQDIFDISVEWVSGSIHILPTLGDQIQVSESGDTENCAMVVQQKNGKLSVEFCKPSLLNSISRNLRKDLVIEVPMNWNLEELEIDAASASVNVEGLTIRNVEFEGASGICEFSNCNVDILDVDTASGDVHFTGTLNKLECDAASSSFTGILANIPSQMEMDSMSGNLDLILPGDAGFTVTIEGMSSDFSTDFETTVNNKTYVSGNGACRIKVNAMSGDVSIRKGIE